MRLVTFEHGDQVRLGAAIGGRVIGLGRAYQQYREEVGKRADIEQARAFEDMLAFLQAGAGALAAARRAIEHVANSLKANEEAQRAADLAFSRGEVSLLPPVARPGKVICVGLNYPSLDEGGEKQRPEYPVLFHKPASALVGDGQAIVIPAITSQVEYEGELAVVIGERARNVRREEALYHVAGFTIANDIGARDIQARASQWAGGKMFDTFCPLGPALVTPDEVPSPGRLRIRTKLSDELVQDDVTASMFFDVPHLVSYISTLTTLEPGDLILAGSPKRVGDRPDPRRFLRPGDTISVEIKGLGVLTNPVEAEAQDGS